MTKVRISQMTFGESEFVRGNKVWRAESLYLFAQAKGYEVRDLPLWAVDLTDSPFSADNLSQFIFQCKRVQDCSEGRETIKAIRLEEMPAPDRIEEE